MNEIDVELIRCWWTFKLHVFDSIRYRKLLSKIFKGTKDSNFVILFPDSKVCRKWLVNWKVNLLKRTNRRRSDVRKIAKFNSNWQLLCYPSSVFWSLFWLATYISRRDHKFRFQWYTRLDRHSNLLNIENACLRYYSTFWNRLPSIIRMNCTKTSNYFVQNRMLFSVLLK